MSGIEVRPEKSGNGRKMSTTNHHTSQQKTTQATTRLMNHLKAQNCTAQRKGHLQDLFEKDYAEIKWFPFLIVESLKKTQRNRKMSLGLICARIGHDPVQYLH